MLMTKEVLSEFAELIRENKCNPYSGNLKTGVDLGTANIVIAVTDEDVYKRQCIESAASIPVSTGR